VEEIGLLNISEEGATIKVAFIKKSGKKSPRYIDVAAQGENSHQVVSIDRDRVFNVDVNLVGPGAVSFISICVSS
jgi:orotate phosphoribosyltransferase